jgi:endonuclease YncB( thermonuclease family)
VTIRNSMQAASDQDFRKEVTIQTHDYDKYKRTLGDVILPDGTSVNHTFVKDGWCWWCREYALGDTMLEGFGARSTRGAERVVD